MGDKGIGPQIPPEFVAKLGIKQSDSDSDSDSDIIGPSPSITKHSPSHTPPQAPHPQPSETTKPQRAEWMLVPPTKESRGIANGGKRGSTLVPIFDSSWTEAPSDKKKKKPSKGKDIETRDSKRRREEDEDKARWVSEYNKKQRPKSLLEMHLESKSKTKSKKERKRFDRTRDLSAGKIDSRRQREMLNNLGFLSDKYAPSKKGSFM